MITDAHRKIILTVAVISAVTLTTGGYSSIQAQGINYPVGNPTATSGAGNARTDADNIFIRNNVAGMTEIPLNDDEERSGRPVSAAKGRWRSMGELQLATYKYSRERILSGPTQGVETETRLGIPGLAGEVTYTGADHRYALGLGLYTIYGFQSKLKDPSQLGPLATFFDTRVASNDLAAGGAVRLHPKLSVGGSVIIGRGFADIAQPNPRLAPLGMLRQDRLDVDGFGAPGVSVGAHFRLNEKISLGVNYKTRRGYNLKGTLETAVVVPGPDGIQIVPVEPLVFVRLKPPAVAEGGIEIKATNKWRIFADFRFYDYTATFQQIDVIDRQSGQPITALRLDALDVRSFRTGSVYSLSETTKLHAGFAYTSNGIPEAFITPGTINLGGFDLSGGIGKRMNGHWLNISVAVVLGQERTIGPPENSLFPGKYRGNGAMLGIGWRL
jgi:Outer membrane protein transport protein (OMPP1/FadL/TodX)